MSRTGSFPGVAPSGLEVCLLGAFLLQACTLVGGSAAPRPDPPAPSTPTTAWAEIGVASWYGSPFHGRRTASGEIYDMNALTGAHPTLPFGTRVRVENLDNGRVVNIRINDRGPYAKERILDVSRRAAEELAMIGPGTARVRITLVGGRLPPPPQGSGHAAGRPGARTP